jgi:hypothetical protein
MRYRADRGAVGRIAPGGLATLGSSALDEAPEEEDQEAAFIESGLLVLLVTDMDVLIV